MLSTLLAKFQAHKENLLSSFLFVPTVLVFSAAVLSFLLVAMDHRYPDQQLSWLFSGSPSAARSLLSTIAGAVITVISIAFSLTIVALQQASTQFSPRIMRNFTNDKGNQLVLGTYIATFLYSLLVLRAVRDPGDSSDIAFAPAIATSVALVLATICVALLVYFINHVANSLQAITIISRVHGELNEQIDAMYPELFVAGNSLAQPPTHPQRPYDGEVSVLAPKAGFILRIAEDSFSELRFSKASHLIVLPSVGDFVSQDQPLAYVQGYSQLSDERHSLISAAIIIGKQRSIKQDPMFAIRQLVDIALKALSPGINDPTTASYCIYYLGDSMGRIAQRALPLPVKTFQNPKAFVHFNKPNWEEFLEAAFSQIQHEARTNPAVTKVLLETFAKLAEVLPSSERAKPLQPLLSTAREQMAGKTFDKLRRKQLLTIIDNTEKSLRRI